MFIIPIDTTQEIDLLRISESDQEEFKKVYIQFEKLDVVLGDIEFAKYYDLPFRIKMYYGIITGFNYLND